jgi:hypothetical protein
VAAFAMFALERLPIETTSSIRRERADWPERGAAGGHAPT